MIRQLSAVALLTACTAPEITQVHYHLEPELVPFSGGFEVTETGGLEIGFGRTYASALASISVFRDPGTVIDTPSGCRTVQWSDGLEAHFDPDFVGWSNAGQSAGRIC